MLSDSFKQSILKEIKNFKVENPDFLKKFKIPVGKAFLLVLMSATLNICLLELIKIPGHIL